MKTAIRTILCAAAVMLAAASCQKSVEPANPVEEGKGTIDIRVNGLMGEYTQVDGTKSSMVNTVRISWENDDIVYVFDGTQCLGSLVASLEGDEDRYALLSTNEEHTVAAPAEGTTKLTLIHSPLLTEAPAVSDGAVSISLADQSGAKAPFVAFATLEYTSTTITGAVVPFQFATSVIKVNCTGLKANTAITSATLSNVNTACKLTLSGTAAPTVSGSTNGTITRTGDEYFAAAKINAEGEAVFQIAVPALESASETRILTVAQGSDKVKDKKFATNSLAPATSVNTVCQLVGPPAGALAGEFTVDNNDTPENPDDDIKIYFSKGNLYYDGSNFNFEANQYDFRTYAGKNSCIDGTSSDNGTPTGHWGLFGWSTDATTYGMSTSQNNGDYSGNFKDWGTAIDDKGTWRTLTTAEWQYLFNSRAASTVSGTENARYAKATVNSKAGIILLPDTYAHPEGVTALTDINTSSVGFTLNDYDSSNWKKMEAAGAVFLPAAGNRNGSDVDNVGVNGYYWSSTAIGSNAYGVRFRSNDVSPGRSVSRLFGYSVRLITESN